MKRELEKAIALKVWRAGMKRFPFRFEAPENNGEDRRSSLGAKRRADYPGMGFQGREEKERRRETGYNGKMFKYHNQFNLLNFFRNSWQLYYDSSEPNFNLQSRESAPLRDLSIAGRRTGPGTFHANHSAGQIKP